MFTTRYVEELPETYSHVTPTPLDDPYWVSWNVAMAEQMQLPVQADDNILQVMAGRALFQGHQPIAQKYAGHQFGGWNPDLGDGRGLLLGEWTSDSGIWEMHLKGAGKTPFSRFADGRAVLRSSIREYLGSEAMHALGVPTTRALAIAGSSERVQRETVETAATVMRVTPSHIRFGHFEWFSYANKPDQLKQLADYVIRHHYPDAADQTEPVLAMFSSVVERTALMVANWMAYGFVHGVMNTDNMSILGETFDYGPYAFLDTTNLNAVFNHTDDRGRYSFKRQPHVALWNLQRLAQALTPLAASDDLNEALGAYEPCFVHHYERLMSLRLGGSADYPIPRTLIDQWLGMLQSEQKDFNGSFRALSALPKSDWLSLKDDFIDRAAFESWASEMAEHIDSADERRQVGMMSVNPITIARTHHLQAVIDAAQKGDLALFESLFAALQSPYEQRDEWSRWHQPPAGSARAVVLSCSS